MSGIPLLTGPQTVLDIQNQLNILILQINGFLEAELDAQLPDGQIFIGNASDVPVGRAISGDISITNLGVVSLVADVDLPGDPTTTTQSPGDNSTKISTTAYVDAAVSDIGNTAREYTKAQNFNATSLVDGANIAWDLEDNQVANIVLGGNRTLDNPTNINDGGTYILVVTQDGTGSRTLAFDTAYKFPGGVAPTHLYCERH
jgi:hypothetical protein